MSTAAQLAQGTKFYVENSTAAAKNITAVAVGYPTILTATSHGFANGDVVTFAALTGADAALLNSLSFVVKNATTNTFAVDVDTTGKTITAGSGTATPATWTEIKEVKGFSPGGAQASQIDVTDLSSSAKEFKTGLVDNGTMSLDVFPLLSDPGQAAVKAAFEGNLVKGYKIVVNGGSTYTFDATVTKFPTVPDGSVDNVLTGSIELKLSGAVTVS